MKEKDNMIKMLKTLSSSISQKREEEAKLSLSLLLSKLENIKEEEILSSMEIDFFEYENIEPIQDLLNYFLKERFLGFWEDKNIWIKNIERATFIITHKMYVEWNIEKTITKHNWTSVCCADKSWFVIRSLLKYYLKNEFTDFSLKKKNDFWTPNVWQDLNIWIKYSEALYMLYYWYNEKYIEFLKEYLHSI